MMTDPLHFISMLAADDDGVGSIVQILFFVVIAVGSVLSAVFKKNAEKRQQEQARQKAREAKDILARRAQREQSGRATPPPPPPRPQPKPSMFAAPPKPVIVEEPDKHRMVDLTPIEHLPPEDQLVHTTMPSSVHPRKASVGDLVRKQPQRMDGRIDRNLHEVTKMTESNVRTRVNLLDPATARAAIIFQEILSPPKALRDKPEIWD